MVHGEGPLLGRAGRTTAGSGRCRRVASASPPDDERQVELPRSHGRPGLGGQVDRHRAPQSRVGGVRRVGSQALGQPGHGVVVLPRLAEDDLDALRGSSRASRAAGVVGGGTGPATPTCRAARGAGLLPPGAAGHPDDARGAGVDGHVSASRARLAGQADGPVGDDVLLHLGGAAADGRVALERRRGGSTCPGRRRRDRPWPAPRPGPSRSTASAARVWASEDHRAWRRGPRASSSRPS